MDREAWHAAIHVVAKSRTWLSNWTELNWMISRITTSRFFTKSCWFPLKFLLNFLVWIWNAFSARGLIESVLHCTCAQSLQSCPTLSDLMDCNPPGSSVHGILQARILEWVGMPSSRGSSPPRDQTHTSYIYLLRQVDSLPLAPHGKPL